VAVQKGQQEKNSWEDHLSLEISTTYILLLIFKIFIEMRTIFILKTKWKSFKGVIFLGYAIIYL